MQGAGLCIGGNLGFIVLPKDSLICDPGEPGIKPPTQSLADNPPSLLSHSHPIDLQH